MGGWYTMKITNFAILFILILFPFIITNSLDIEAQKKALFVETQYNISIDTATQDAAAVLITNSEQDFESQYESLKFVRVNKELAVETFFKTIYLNFGVDHDTYGQGVLRRYIPALVIIGYDGYFIYSEQEFIDSKGRRKLEHVWSEKKPYSYKDKTGNLISFTLDDYITVYEKSSNQIKKGFLFDRDENGQKELANEWKGTTVSLLNSPTTFESVRRQTIVSQIQSDLEYEINKHNQLVRRYGVAYTFILPSISQEEWDNTIDDVGVLAFVQGIPVGTKYYNNFALGGSRILKKPSINGVISNGTKYYYDRSVCKSSISNTEIFSSAKEAAENGYHPLSCQNK